jgi:putative endonuclease
MENLSGWKQAVGKWGESLAAKYLTRNGYQIVARNFRTPHGEIDLVALHAGQLVFVEVKTRTSRTYGLPEESITPRKQAHMLSAAEHYLERHPEHEAWQYDVIAIERQHSGKVEIQHFENALG